MKDYIITAENIQLLVNDVLKQGWDVVSESKTGVNFNAIKDASELAIKSDSKPSKLSMKDFFFPKTEPLFFYRQSHDGVELVDASPIEKKTLFLGAKPCDAAAIPVLSKVFNWDYKDEFYNKRVENSVVVSLKCNYSDDYCFCTSIGLSQKAEQGSDAMLTEQQDGSYFLHIVTEKGDEFFKTYSQYLKDTQAENNKPVESKYPEPAVKFDQGKVKGWLDANFEHDFWNNLGDVCLGCGQCTFVCPTCHCFDIVDENCNYHEGGRMKNWDSCQLCLFTKHASGHNPRDGQTKRYRQRIQHKFKYYEDKFNEVLCTGCGRCTRGCGVGVDIGGIMESIDKL